MGLRINTNVPSLVAQHQLAGRTRDLQETSGRLSTGHRITKAKDDAAGLSISERMRADLLISQQNIENAKNGFYLLQTADGALHEVVDILVRMKELSMQAANGGTSARGRALIHTEFKLLREEIFRIAHSTVYNEHQLLNGDGVQVLVQVGPNNGGPLDRIQITDPFDVTPDALGIGSLNITEKVGAQDSLEALDDAITRVGKIRGSIGAGESRLNSTVNSLMHYKENITGAYSQIRDADMAVETSNYAKHKMLTQAGLSILAQANSAPEAALRLLS